MPRKDIFEAAATATAKATQETTQFYAHENQFKKLREFKEVGKPKRELKSKRVQLLTFPSLYAEMEKAALKANLSLNEAINEAMRNFIAKTK